MEKSIILNIYLLPLGPLFLEKKAFIAALIFFKQAILNFTTRKRVHYERNNEFYATQRNGRNP